MRNSQIEILFSEVLAGPNDIADLQQQVNKLLQTLGEGKRKPNTRLTWLKDTGRIYCFVEYGDYE